MKLLWLTVSLLGQVSPCYLPLGGTDPCDGLACRPGARCVLSPRGDDPRCVCPTSCPDYGDHSGSRPLCGSDGRDYKDMCTFNKASCAVEGGLQIKYHGPCDPCAGVPCPPGEVCLVSEGRVARCSCLEQCPLDHAPVCANDGRTFNNECALRADACRNRKKLRVQYRGPCDQGINPCSEVKCEFGATCEVNDKGRAECVCGPPCEEVMRPVCGSDGNTHQSLCHLRRAACVNRTKIEVLHSGVCGGEGPCSQKSCPPPSTCVEQGDAARCECPGCPGDYDPVCGSDGVSYSNHCKLQRQACVHSKQIKLLYKGLCNGCENKKCEFYAICQIDVTGEANCECPANCSEETSSDEEVCGSDGKTYSSECELKQISCLNKVPLHVARRGPCGESEEDCPMDCTGAPAEQVCGSDLVTYPSQCELLKRACEIRSSGIRLEVLFYGSCQHRGPVYKNTTPLPGGPDPEEACRGVRCQFSATCELDPSGYPRCACRFACPAGGQPVCGSDFVLYQNKCEMEAAACSKQLEIRVRPLDLCKGMEVKPCGGDPPLVDSVTGEEMDCGNGHNRQDCPSDYYCHQTPQFAKCCRKESGIYLKDCSDSWYGCCPDGKTPAQGVDQEGCPSMCGCNKIGSYSDWCDKETGACECRPGVGGPKCDRCEPGYWGLPKISSGYKGCLPCGCSLFGSVREDCEQMTGRCVCKPGVSGHKCDTCPVTGQILTPAGCTMADVTTPVPTSCSQLICYFGAVCEERGGRASCVCTATCPNPDKQQIVCGSDGQTYGSECQLKLYACKYQKDIAVQSLGACKEEESVGGTEGPVRRWTSYSQYTLPDDIASPLSKSTRHLLTEKYNLPGKSRDVYIVEGHATSVGVELGAGLGQPCSYDIDCAVASSVCKSGSCVCKMGHVESQGLCIPEESPSFTGQSWMRLRKLKAYHKFSLELEFLSYNEDGILFYTQQHQDGTGDFISLALVNGHVLLNYNLGSGTVSVPSLGRVSLGTWHSVKVRRYQRDALLQVDNEQGVRGQSQGTLTGLDLDDHAYLGYVPTNFTKVFQNAGTHLGLVGCMRSPGLAPEESHMIGSSCLHNPCRGISCHNHGSCVAAAPRPVCACQPDFTGKHCEEKLNPCVYSVCVGGTECIPIEGGGFDCVCTSREAPCASAAEETEPAEIGPEPLVLPRLEGVSRALALSISFATISTDGTILYNGQGQHNKGDFLSLKLSQGRLVFSFSLGGNPVSIVTKEKIEPGEWHTARVSRLDKEGFLRLDSGRIYRGISVGQHLELNLDHPLYIGAPPFDAEEWPVFNGAVKSFIVNGHRMLLSGARPCTLSVCSVNTTSSTICEGCGIIENEAIHFDGSTVVKYPKKPLKRNETEFEEDEDLFEEEIYEENYTEEEEDLEEMEDDYEVYDDYTFDYTDERQKRRGGMRIEVSIKSSGPDGALILGKGGQGFWGLVILNNSVKFIAHQVEIASKVIVTDGRWHRISALKRRKSLSLRVDREGLIRASLPSGVRATTRKYFVGGSPPGAEGLYPGFQGCVRGLRIDGRLVPLEGRSCPVS